MTDQPRDMRPIRYSILRYADDLVRDEWFNVAAAVWAENDRYADCIVLDNWRRFARLYGALQARWVRAIAENRAAQVRDGKLTVAKFPAATEGGPYDHFLWTPLRGGIWLPYDLHLRSIYRRFVAWPVDEVDTEVRDWSAANPVRPPYQVETSG